MVNEIYPLIKDEVFKAKQRIGFPEEGGTTGYWSHNMTKTDLKLVQDFLKNQSIDILNTRAWKNSSDHFTISVGSIDSNGSASGIKFKNNVFDIQFGEFSAYLREVNRNLEKAIEFSANKNESKMLQKYIEHFKSGNISTHKDSQREWIKDQ